MLILGAGVLCAAAQGASAPGGQPAGGQAPATRQAGPADFVGAEKCASCHEKVAQGFASNPHSKLAGEHGGSGATCEACHGAGREHVEAEGDKTKIFNPGEATAKEVDAKCLSCHQGQHASFERSAHGEGNVSCIGCHSIHASAGPAHLLKAAQPMLCFECHADVKPQFSMPFHHPVSEGLVQCTDCHDPHGTFEKNNLKAAADQNQVCMKCHSETAGPFVYEHPPIKTEGCVSCHSPHGSQNPRMLVRNNVNTMCMQCHTNSVNFTAPGTPSFHNQANQYQACTVCHTQIHGSNASSIFFK